MVLHGDLGSVFDLLNGELHQLAHRGGRHGAGRADLRLTAAFRAGDRGVVPDKVAEQASHAERLGDLAVGQVVFLLHILEEIAERGHKDCYALSRFLSVLCCTGESCFL